MTAEAPAGRTGATDSEAAHEAAVAMIRTWIDRHPRPQYGDDTWWPDWAARNFLADPEVRAHVTLVAEQRTTEERLAAVLAVADEPDIKCRCSANQSEDDDERDDHASWCLANPNKGVPDAEVTNSAKVTHRCEYRAAAYDRKLYADEIYRQLREMREAVLAIHTPVPTWTDSTLDTVTGETEQNALYADDGSLIYAPDHRMHCQNCRVDTPWPCPTAAAAGAL